MAFVSRRGNATTARSADHGAMQQGRACRYSSAELTIPNKFTCQYPYAVWGYLQSRDVLAGTPRLGILDTDGDWLERKTTESDVLVYADPAAIVAGDDRQLRRAVKVLLQELDSEASP